MDRSRPSFMTKEQLDKYLTDLQQSRTGTIRSRVASNLDQGLNKRWSMSEIPRVEPAVGATVDDAVNEIERRDSPENYTTVRSSMAIGGSGPGTGSLRVARTERGERGQRGGWRTNNGWLRPTRSNTIDSTSQRGLSDSGPQSNSNGNIQATQNTTSKPVQGQQRSGSGAQYQEKSQVNQERNQYTGPAAVHGTGDGHIQDRNLNPTIEVQEDEDDPGYMPSEEPIAPAPLKITKAKTAETNYSLHSSQRPEATPEVTNNSKIAYSANTAPNPGSGPPELEQRPKWNDMAIPTHTPPRPQTPPTRVRMVEDGKVVGEMVLPQEVDESKLTLAHGNAWSKGVRPSAEVARLPMAMEKKLSGGSSHPQIQSMTFDEFAAMDLKISPPAEKADTEPQLVTHQSIDLTRDEKKVNEVTASIAKTPRTSSVDVAESQKRLEQLQLGKDGPVSSNQPENPRVVPSSQSVFSDGSSSRSTMTPTQQQYGRPAPRQMTGPRANPGRPQPAQPAPQMPEPVPSITFPEEAPAPPSHAPANPTPPRHRHWQQPPQRQRSQDQQAQQQHQPQRRQEQPVPAISVPEEPQRNNSPAAWQHRQKPQQQQPPHQQQQQQQQQPRPVPTFSFSEDPAPAQRQSLPQSQNQNQYNQHQKHQQPASKPPIPTFSFSEDPSPATSRPAPPQQPPIPTISFPDDTPPTTRRALPQQPPIPTISFPDDASSNPAPAGQRPLPTVAVESARGHHSTPRPLPPATSHANGSRPLPPPKDHPASRNGRHDAYNTHYHHASDRIPRSKAICTACRNPITARAVNAMNLHFHPECFSCSHCRIRLEHVAFYPEPLPEGAPPNTPRSGRFYCHCDFHELFSPRCKSCKTPVEGEVVFALGASWHVGHFFCAECGDPFDSNTKFVEKENYAWCIGCYQRRYSTKCKRCRKPVTDTVVKALDAEWHVECFCCTECGSQFDDGRYFLRGGSSQDPVCVRCEEERLKS